MYLHLGKGTVVNEKTIVGIFDRDITSQFQLTRRFLAAAEKAGEVINAAEDIPKSFLGYAHCKAFFFIKFLLLAPNDSLGSIFPKHYSAWFREYNSTDSGHRNEF